MIQIKQIKMPVRHTEFQLHKKVCQLLHISKEALLELEIVKQSLDARKKNNVHYVYTVWVRVAEEGALLRKSTPYSRGKSADITCAEPVAYKFPEFLRTDKLPRPVIVGSGPAGLFCAYVLAENGFSPIIIERGRMVSERKEDVAGFWSGHELNPNSNVQFGEGGAGTFSDGKLNTLVKDVKGRNQKVLHTFIKMGAAKEIAYLHKPHIGTDILQTVTENMREAIKEMGGTFCFETCVTDINIHNNHLRQLILTHTPTGEKEELDTKAAIFAIGHSARDTFSMLYDKGIDMEAKSFAVGLRVEHPQKQISMNQYGREYAALLPAADYKLQTRAANGRGVYSFCMCPGGYVVNASSEEERLTINGMSYSKRAGKNANSAIIVTVTPKDFWSDHPLSGVDFQRELESKAYQLAGGFVPQQLFGDFIKKQASAAYGAYESCFKGRAAFAPLHEMLKAELYEAFIEGMYQFAHSIENFDRQDCILSGIESRTSSPVRILRDDHFISNIKGIYPCGEGAGYAGGIMSAAMDGLKTAEAFVRNSSFSHK